MYIGLRWSADVRLWLGLQGLRRLLLSHAAERQCVLCMLCPRRLGPSGLLLANAITPHGNYLLATLLPRVVARIDGNLATRVQQATPAAGEFDTQALRRFSPVSRLCCSTVHVD